MKRALVFSLALVLAPIAGQAHSVLKASTPAHESVMAEPPESLDLTFAKGMRLTALALGGETLDLPDQSGFGLDFSVPLPVLASGEHTVTWRGLSEDGHPMKGTFNFVIE